MSCRCADVDLWRRVDPLRLDGVDVVSLVSALVGFRGRMDCLMLGVLDRRCRRSVEADVGRVVSMRSHRRWLISLALSSNGNGS